MKKIYLHFGLLVILAYIEGCFPASSNNEEEEEKKEENTEVTEINESESSSIINAAKAEQENRMYRPSQDSTYLYWLNNKLILLNGSTKCNIFALNVLFRSGFKTPKTNALSRDLFDTDKFTDILPVVGINDIDNVKKGDLVVWNGHVIILESLTKIKDDLYAIAWWAGTRQKDNGENIKNNVCYGKYRLNGNFVVRRPVKSEK
ncbi:MAG TPA: hypothetical protein VGK25_07810 [Ignavibacteria bacterium]|jgi:hypothetical protein